MRTKSDRAAIYFGTDDIPEDVRALYKAAGILPVTFLNNIDNTSSTGHHSLNILLGEEKRRQNFSSWSDFGGKRKVDDEGCERTALREFNEESHGIFSDQLENFYSVLSSSERLPCAWIPEGKYLLFLVEIPPHPPLEDFIYSTPKHRLRYFSLPELSVALKYSEPPLFPFFRTVITRSRLLNLLASLGNPSLV